MDALAEVRRRQHRVKRSLYRARWVRQEVGDPRKGLVGFGVENMQNGTDEQRMAGLLPMISALECTFGIDQNIGDILGVADLIVAFTNLKQRIVGGARRIGRIK